MCSLRFRGFAETDAEIEVIVTVTDLRLWYNNFVINAVFSLWAGAVN